MYVQVVWGTEVTGLVGLLASDVPAERADARGTLIEGIIEESEDEGLMDRYLGGEPVTEDALLVDLHRAMSRGTFFPVVAACSTSGVGCAELLDRSSAASRRPASTPARRPTRPPGARADPVTCDRCGPLVAEVVKTTSDPYVGRVSLVRVFSGTLDTGPAGARVGAPDLVLRRRVGPRGPRRRRAGRVAVLPVRPAAPARQPGGCRRHRRRRPAHPRRDRRHPLLGATTPGVLQPWTLPTPLLPVAIEASTRSDEDKLSPALEPAAAEDPSLRVDIGQRAAGALDDGRGARRRRAGAAAQTGSGSRSARSTCVVPLRETIAGPRPGLGRHVKQSGGHGQYAVCEIEVEPLPRGSGFEFAERVVGGAVPRQFIPSVEKGIRAQMDRGVAGYPMVDVRVTLTGGKAHSVDSSDMAFQSAGALALRDASETPPGSSCSSRTTRSRSTSPTTSSAP